ELGGHSLLAVQAATRLREELGVEVTAWDLFTWPVLADLAAEIGDQPRGVEAPPNGIPAGCEAITPEMLPLVKLTEAEIESIVGEVDGGAANVQDIYPLTALQEGILFHHLMATAGDTYLISSLIGFDTRARMEGYLRALQAVIDRHDILRTGVAWAGLSEPVQVGRRR